MENSIKKGESRDLPGGEREDTVVKKRIAAAYSRPPNPLTPGGKNCQLPFIVEESQDQHRDPAQHLGSGETEKSETNHNVHSQENGSISMCIMEHHVAVLKLGWSCTYPGVGWVCSGHATSRFLCRKPGSQCGGWVNLQGKEARGEESGHWGHCTSSN